MWNYLELECPDQDTCRYSQDNKADIEELHNLVSVLTTSAEVLTQDHTLWTEIEVFRYIQEKYKRILRCDKCVQLLHRLGTCIKKMVLLNLSKSYLNLADRFLIGFRSTSKSLYLPSRQQLEFILIRTQSATKLICEGMRYSRDLFCYLLQKLRVGHIILDLIMTTSVTARVNIFFKALLVQLFDMYKKLRVWRKKLKKGNWTWPNLLKLPADLEKWLQSEDPETFNLHPIAEEHVNFLNKFYEQKKNENSNDRDSDFIDINEEDVNECVILEESTRTSVDIDMGEVIPRENENSMCGLTETQTLLLAKIKRAKTVRGLTIIWNNIGDNSQDLLPKALTASQIRHIDKLFMKLKLNEVRRKESNLPSQERKKEVLAIVQATANKLAKRLGLLESTVSDMESFSQNSLNQSTDSVTELKPVKTYKELQELYRTLYHKLNITEQHVRCKKLKKFFKCKTNDIKLLEQNRKTSKAKKLILAVSKVFLSEYQ